MGQTDRPRVFRTHRAISAEKRQNYAEIAPTPHDRNRFPLQSCGSKPAMSTTLRRGLEEAVSKVVYAVTSFFVVSYSDPPLFVFAVCPERSRRVNAVVNPSFAVMSFSPPLRKKAKLCRNCCNSRRIYECRLQLKANRCTRCPAEGNGRLSTAYEKLYLVQRFANPYGICDALYVAGG